MKTIQQQFIGKSLLLAVMILSLISDKAIANSTFLLDDTIPAFASDGLNNGDSIIVDGIEITFSNVVVSDGSAIGDVDGTGILISGIVEPGLTDVISFDFSFSKDVILNSYDIGTREDIPSGSVFSVIGSNGTSGDNTIPSGTSFTEETFSFDQGTIPFFIAGEVYSFSHNLTDEQDSLFNLEQIVVTLVPEPASSLLVILGVAGTFRRRS